MPSKTKTKEASNKRTLSKDVAVTKRTPKLDSVPLEVSSEDDSEDDEGIDEEGMARLMKALGEDALDEFDQAQLRSLAGEDDSEDGEVGDEINSDDEDVAVGGSSQEEDNDEGGGSGGENGEIEDDEDEENQENEVGAEDLAIPLDEIESVDEDAVPRQKIEIDNKVALERIRETIQLDPSLPWTETLTVSYPEMIDVDVDDDLNRELAFYKQALHGANAARALAAKNDFPFTRPSDYFAEMVKSDAHMERIRQRLLDETAGIKKSEDKRKEREGKKFGKQVQIEKLKERERSKKEMDERLKSLKRKRQDVLGKPQGDDDFDIAVEDAIADRPAKRGRGTGGRGVTRESRDKKYGFGGAGRRSKQNTKDSTDNFDSGSGRGKRGGRGGKAGGFGKGVGRDNARGRGGSKRLGKSKRMDARSKK